MTYKTDHEMNMRIAYKTIVTTYKRYLHPIQISCTKDWIKLNKIHIEHTKDSHWFIYNQNECHEYISIMASLGLEPNTLEYIIKNLTIMIAYDYIK